MKVTSLPLSDRVPLTTSSHFIMTKLVFGALGFFVLLQFAIPAAKHVSEVASEIESRQKQLRIEAAIANQRAAERLAIMEHNHRMRVIEAQNRQKIKIAEIQAKAARIAAESQAAAQITTTGIQNVFEHVLQRPDYGDNSLNVELARPY